MDLRARTHDANPAILHCAREECRHKWGTYFNEWTDAGPVRTRAVETARSLCDELGSDRAAKLLATALNEVCAIHRAEADRGRRASAARQAGIQANGKANSNATRMQSDDGV